MLYNGVEVRMHVIQVPKLEMIVEEFKKIKGNILDVKLHTEFDNKFGVLIYIFTVFEAKDE